MRIERLGPIEVAAMRNAGQVAAATLEFVCSQLRAGMNTLDIDRLVRADTAGRGAVPSQLGYHGFPAAVCTSINHVVCHGIPSAKDVLADGDIINVDVTSEFNGFHGDTSRTVFIGHVDAKAAHVTTVARDCVSKALASVKPGLRLGDLGSLICDVAEGAGCSVVLELGGHGIGRSMHMAPHISYERRPGRGIRLEEGMAFTIEPMINYGKPDVIFLDDGWTVVTADGSLSAQFEHTVLVTANGCEVLTRRDASPREARAQ